jgi:hypothetical protein
VHIRISAPNALPVVRIQRTSGTYGNESSLIDSRRIRSVVRMPIISDAITRAEDADQVDGCKCAGSIVRTNARVSGTKRGPRNLSSEQNSVAGRAQRIDKLLTSAGRCSKRAASFKPPIRCSDPLSLSLAMRCADAAAAAAAGSSGARSGVGSGVDDMKEDAPLKSAAAALGRRSSPRWRALDGCCSRRRVCRAATDPSPRMRHSVSRWRELLSRANADPYVNCTVLLIVNRVRFGSFRGSAA